MFEKSVPFGMDPMLFGLLMLATLLGMWWYWERRKSRRFQAKYIAEALPHDATQVSEVQMTALEVAIGGKLPELLRNAYLDGSIARVVLPAATQGGAPHFSDSEWIIVQLIAADPVRNGNLAQWNGRPHNVFFFAGDDFGNFYYVKADQKQVYFWNHESGDDDDVALHPDFEQFWNSLRPFDAAAR